MQHLRPIAIPYSRLFPRWRAPKSLRGNYPPAENSLKAQQAFIQRHKTGPSQALEADIVLDPDISLRAAAEGHILNKQAIQEAIQKKPLLVTEFAKACRWANLGECLYQANNNAELAFEFHNLGLDTNPNDSIDVFLESAHYSWRALTELNLSKENVSKINGSLADNPLYGALTLPEGEERRDYLLRNENASKEGALTALLWKVTQAPNDRFPTDAVIRLLQEKGVLNSIGKETLALLALTEANQNDDEGLEPHVLHHYIGKDPTLLYLLTVGTQNKNTRAAHLTFLQKNPHSEGWLLQLSLDVGDKYPDLAAELIYQQLSNLNPLPEETVELNKWKIATKVAHTTE